MNCFQPVAATSSDVKQDVTVSHSVKSVMATITALMAATKPTAVRVAFTILYGFIYEISVAIAAAVV